MGNSSGKRHLAVKASSMETKRPAGMRDDALEVQSSNHFKRLFGIRKNKVYKHRMKQLENEIATVRDTFIELDTDLDGMLERVQVFHLLEQLGPFLGYPPTQKDVTQMYVALGVRGDEMVSWEHVRQMLWLWIDGKPFYIGLTSAERHLVYDAFTEIKVLPCLFE